MLDESDDLATPESLLGNISLSDNERSIEECSVYLDSWLDALIKGLQLINEKNEELRIEIPEESQPMIMRPESDGALTLSFRGRSVSSRSLSEFISELRVTSVAFIERIKNLKDIDRNGLVCSIRDFAKG